MTGIGIRAGAYGHGASVQICAPAYRFFFSGRLRA